jgi:hypothetical protein
MIQPEHYRTVKQPRYSLICVAAVAAMATGETLQQAYAAMTPTMHKEEGKPFFKTVELLKYLGAHGIFSGIMVSEDNAYLSGLDENTDVVATCPMNKLCAILTVRSDTDSNWTHYVFWDSQHVRDPNPSKPDTTCLTDYEILDIMFITYLEEEIIP